MTGLYRSDMPVGTPLRITWIDARHVSTSWVSVAVAASAPPCEVVSVGAFVAVTDDELFYAADLVDGQGELQANAVSAIPLGCVRLIEQIGDHDG
jgi:hypothetical protein